MKKNKRLINLSFTVILGIIFSILCSLKVFEKLDFRLYDGLLRFTKDPPMSEKVMVIGIGDEDIEHLGEWPWSRDIIADVLIRLKELGADTTVFDIEYISKSAKAISSNAEENLMSKLSATEQSTVEMLYSFPDAFSQGYTAEDAYYLADEFLLYLYPLYNDLYDSVQNNISFDNDEYFAKAIKFFKNTYLTVNYVDLGLNPEDIADEINFIQNNMLFSMVKDEKNFISNDNIYNFKETYPEDEKGFTPALDIMVRSAKGVGYTNSNIDSDGIRRRNELLYEHEGKYLGQLSFSPLVDILDVQEIERNKFSLTLKGALFPDETERVDVKIPLDENGKMLINYRHGNTKEKGVLYGCPIQYVSTILQLDDCEEDIINNIKILLGDDGDFDDSNNLQPVFDVNGYPLAYYDDLVYLIDLYNYLSDCKQDMLNRCICNEEGTFDDELQNVDYETYFDLRTQFFDEVKAFTQKNYINDIAVFASSEEELELYSLLFDELENAINSYLEFFDASVKEFNGKYCIIGQTAASTTDIGANPFNKQYINVLIHANVMNTILTRNFITPLPWYWGFLVAFIISIILSLLLSEKSSTVQNLVGGITRFVVIILSLFTLPVFQIYIPIVGSVIFFLVFDFLAGVVYRYLMSSRERRFITEIASSFANKDTVAQLRDNPDAFKTEGQKKCITALFSDIQKFSTLSESIGRIYGDEGPNKLIQILNEYLGSMSNEILKNNGNIDKYEGDAIISMFGAPDPMNTHTKEEWAFLCLDSAIRMKKAEVEFNKTHPDLFNPVEIENENGEKETIQLKPLQTRIGINSGEAFVGLMGSKTESFSKLNYTMIGDTVNLASRLEGVNKVYGSWIMCSEDTWNMANTGDNEGKITVRRLDRVRVVGRSTPVQLYNVLGYTEELTQLEKQELEMFNKALDNYLNKNFAEAGKMFVQASKMLPDGDPTALIFADRCKTYIKKGVSEDWDGVMNMTSK